MDTLYTNVSFILHTVLTIDTLCTNVLYRLRIVQMYYIDNIRYLFRYVMYKCIIHITYCTETCCGVLRQQSDIFDQFNLSTTYDIKLKDFIY